MSLLLRIKWVLNSWRNEVMLSLGWLLNHFYAIPLNVHGKVMAVSSVINVLGIRLCHIGIQMIIRVGSSIKGVDGWHIDFLGTWLLYNLYTERGQRGW